MLGARRIERLDAVADEIRERGGSAATGATDVARPDNLERLVGMAEQAFGRLDVLVSNAGISKIGPLADRDVDGWSAMIDINLRGVLHGLAAALVDTELDGCIDDATVREQIRRNMNDFGLPPEAVGEGRTGRAGAAGFERFRTISIAGA